MQTIYIALAAAVAAPAFGSHLPRAKRALAESFRAVADESAAPSPHVARISRRALTAGETAAEIEFEVPLKLRNLDELQARVAAGEIISADEMAAKYLPTADDYARTAAWLAAQGLTVMPDGSGRAVFGHGRVDRLQTAFGAAFARVTYEGGEYTSAIAAPEVPADLADVIVGVNGLQPHLRVKRHLRRMTLAPQSLTSSNPPYTPAQIAKAYGASGLAATGSGQTIAIVGETTPASSDLTMFWGNCGIGQTTANVTTIQVVSGTLPASSSDAGAEATLDVEWASGLAPAAKIRVYATVDGNLIHFDQAYSRVLSDLSANPGLKQVSISYGAPEATGTTASQVRTDGQYFLQLAAAGVSVFVSSGDGGSNPDSTGAYSATATKQVESPASDPNVTAVGGTRLTVSSTTGAASAESAWVDGGGGASVYVSRPSWQTGAGVPAGTARLVPDVASAGDPNTGAYVIWKGTTMIVGGTSWSAPTWAGFCAMINQVRMAASQGSVGLLNSKIYGLLGTGNFRDITSGTNGAYSASAGYDECTGVGVPNVAALMTTLAGSAPAVGGSGSGTTGSSGGTSASGAGSGTSGAGTGTGTSGSSGSGGTGTTTTGTGTAGTGTGTSGTTGTGGTGTTTTGTGTTGTGTTGTGGTGTTQPIVVAPSITAQPVSVAVAYGGSATFSVTATGTSPFLYQWYKNNAAISGASSSSLALKNVQAGDAGLYKVSITNSAGTATSNAATLAVNLAPIVVAAPGSQVIADGAGGTLSVSASGPGLAYQWQFNGVDIAGATSASLSLANLSTAQAGVYSVRISNSSGSVTVSALVAVEVNARMVNLSSRGYVDANNALIAGFSISGSLPKQILFRAVGPGLSAFGIAEPLAQPSLTVYDAAGNTIDSGGAWSGSASLSTMFGQVGAFPLAAGSADAALAEMLFPGLYTSVVTGSGGAGTALVEVYDEDLLSSPSRLVNLSCRANVGAGQNSLTAGFVVAGTSSETVLIRGIGPTLALYGVPGALVAPQIAVFDGTGAQVAVVSGWNASLAPVFAHVGAFPLPAGSADCALMLNLEPGSYTVQLTGANGATGAGLVEVYDVP